MDTPAPSGLSLTLSWTRAAAARSAAPGGPVGQSQDLITPLNVRDPSALVMGPAEMTQPSQQRARPEAVVRAPAR